MHNKKVLYACIWVLFIIYLFSFLFTTSNDFSQDLGRHIKLGEIIVQTKSVPKINLFSFTNPNFSFINHHWFSEVIFFLSQKWMGLTSLIVLKTVVVGLSLVIAASTSGSLWGVAVGFLLSPLILERADIRPEIFGFLFFSLLLFQLKRLKKGKHISPFVPVIFLLWVNMHISFVFGLFLLGIIFLVADKGKWNTVITLLSFLCLFINPNGVGGVLAPFTIFNNYGYSIVENQNIFFLQSRTSDIFIKGFFLSLPFVLGALYFLCRKKDYAGSLLLCVFTSLTFFQVRHFPFFIITALVFIPDALKSLKIHFGLTTKALLCYSFIILLFCGIVFFGTNMFFETFDINKAFGTDFTLSNKKIFFYLKQNPPKGNIFNNFDIGSYLIYGLYPDMKVFVDGRPEAYPASFFQNIYIPIEEDEKMQERYFKQYDIHTVIVSHTDQTPWGQTFLARIARDKRWKMTYVDSTFVFFTDTKNAIDIRTTDRYIELAEEENDFFKLASYIHFFEVIGKQDVSISLLKKMNTLRPSACSLIRMHSMQNDSPWCY